MHVYILYIYIYIYIYILYIYICIYNYIYIYAVIVQCYLIIGFNVLCREWNVSKLSKEKQKQRHTLRKV